MSFSLLQLGCDRNKYGSCGPASRYFNIIGVELTPKASVLKNGNYVAVTLGDLDSASFDKFQFDSKLKVAYYSLMPKTAISFFPQAYANEPCLSNGYDGSEEKLAGIYLISLGKYSADILPGDTLKDAYLINDQFPSEYISNNSRKINQQLLIIRLAKRPDPKEYQSFKLIYKLTNGETYEVITPRFKLY